MQDKIFTLKTLDMNEFPRIPRGFIAFCGVCCGSECQGDDDRRMNEGDFTKGGLHPPLFPRGNILDGYFFAAERDGANSCPQLKRVLGILERKQEFLFLVPNSSSPVTDGKSRIRTIGSSLQGLPLSVYSGVIDRCQGPLRLSFLCLLSLQVPGPKWFLVALNSAFIFWVFFLLIFWHFGASRVSDSHSDKSSNHGYEDVLWRN